MAKRAFITGVSGQDGSYLAEHLLSLGYEVHGLVPTCQNVRPDQIVPHPPKDASLVLHTGELTDMGRLTSILDAVRPDELYHLAAQSNPSLSFEEPEYTADITGLGALRVLEAVRGLKLKTRIFHASSADMFGKAAQGPQAESVRFHPCSPYGAAKVFAHWIMVNYRESYDLFICNGILFNHESPRRSEAFVSRKITMGLARIQAGQQEKIHLGNLEAKRDWGFAGDTVEAMHLMLQHETPDDYVVATGEAHSVREFVEEAFRYAGVDPGRHIETDPSLLRPSEAETLVGDSRKARRVLQWRPKLDFRGLVRHMVDSDFQLHGLKPPR